MTMITIWVVSTCIPGQSDPCLPNVFATEAEALAHLDKMMREEWDSDAPNDEEGTRLAYPGDWIEAQDALKEYLGEEWGTWELSSHTLDVPAATIIVELDQGERWSDAGISKIHGPAGSVVEERNFPGYEDFRQNYSHLSDEERRAEGLTYDEAQDAWYFSRQHELKPIEDIFDRVAPGEPMPSGQCPRNQYPPLVEPPK